MAQQPATPTTPPAERLGLLCVVSGPSGAGKTTLCRNLGETDPLVAHSISCTTRPPRDGEIDGRDYQFLGESAFAQRVADGEFLEHATVHGCRYGTLAASVIARLRAGLDVVMDLDVKGAAQLRQHPDPLIRRCSFDVFVMPDGPDELRARLATRATKTAETADELTLRLRNALDEMRHWPDYDYLILSRTREDDFRRFRTIIDAERLRVTRLDGDSS